MGAAAVFQPPTVNYVAGSPWSVNSVNAFGNSLLYLYQRPYYAAYNNTATSITATAVQVPLDQTDISNYGITLISNNLVVPYSGIYTLYWMVTINAVDAGAVSSTVYQNGSAIRGNSQSSGGGTFLSVGGMCNVHAQALDTFGLWAASVPNENTLTGSNHTYLHIIYQSGA